MARRHLASGGVSDVCEVRLGEDRQHHWGSRPCPGSGTSISVRHDPQRFWAVFLGEVAALNKGVRRFNLITPFSWQQRPPLLCFVLCFSLVRRAVDHLARSPP